MPDLRIYMADFIENIYSYKRNYNLTIYKQ